MRTAATILHVDLDAFFVSIELLYRPELRGLPVIVGGTGNRGVVTTASYEARKFGVRSAMPISQARRLCPQGVYINSNYALYGPASKTFHGILRDFTPLVESAGADEAYLDVTGCERLFGAPSEIGEAIRSRVRAEIGITASVGVSTSKLVSKVASDAAKPDGMVVVPAGSEADFFAPRPIRELPFIGAKTAAVLQRIGVQTIGDIVRYGEGALIARFGPHGADLHRRALGEDSNPVLSGRGTAKSISREMTFGTDEVSGERLRALIRGQAERVAADLARQDRAARTVTLKLRFPPFETLTRSVTAPAPIDLADEIYELGTMLFERAWAENETRPVRLIGIGVANLVERVRQMRLGEKREADKLAETVGAIRDRFGDTAVRRAAELGNRFRVTEDRG